MRHKTENIKGITLIVLVITIIVLLILAGVSIATLTGQNGIIAQAQNAKKQNEYATAKEKVNASIIAASSRSKKGDLDADKLIEQIKNRGGTASKRNDGFPVDAIVDGKNFIIDKDGNIVEKKERPGLKVGDYINYKPDTSDGKTYSLQGIYSGYSKDQTIAKETLNWRILKIKADGSIDIISDPINNTVRFGGSLGYNNGVYLLNDICKELYSNTSKGVTARSVNLKDMESWLTDAGKTARDKYTSQGIKYGENQTYTGGNSYTPDVYNLEEDENSNHYISPTTKTSTKLETLNTKQTYYNLLINEENFGNGAKVLNNSSSYWVAAHYVNCFSYYANFGLRDIHNGMNGGASMFNSNNRNGSSNDHIRAVVSVGSDVKINANTGDSPENAHTIEW